MGSNNGNISFDSMSNPVSVNIAFFDGSVRLLSFAQAKAKFTKSLWEGR